MLFKSATIALIPALVAAQTCTDNTDFEFILDIGAVQNCAWLTKNSENMAYRIDTYCVRGHVSAACPDSCDTCNEVCEDDINFKFDLDIDVEQDCEWLTRNVDNTAIRIANYCFRGLPTDTLAGFEVAAACPDACGFCPDVSDTSEPTAGPSAPPTKTPTSMPTINPTSSDSTPSASPTRPPSPLPSPFPTLRPTSEPSDSPSEQPSDEPSVTPSTLPSDSPSEAPSMFPSDSPSEAPSDEPSISPSSMPSDSPSKSPSSMPSDQPSSSPSDEPSVEPSGLPSDTPTRNPSSEPSITPTNNPTKSVKPSAEPSAAPSPPPGVTPTIPPTLELCIYSSVAKDIAMLPKLQTLYSMEFPPIHSGHSALMLNEGGSKTYYGLWPDEIAGDNGLGNDIRVNFDVPDDGDVYFANRYQFNLCATITEAQKEILLIEVAQNRTFSCTEYNSAHFASQTFNSVTEQTLVDAAETDIDPLLMTPRQLGLSLIETSMAEDETDYLLTSFPADCCTDRSDFELTLNHDLSVVQDGCGWLTKNINNSELRTSTYCKYGSVKWACQLTCGSCGMVCADNIDFTFTLDIGGEPPKDCGWLTQSPDETKDAVRIARYCPRGEGEEWIPEGSIGEADFQVGANCPETCGFCPE